MTYESLIEVGSFMGSGGLIVMDDTSCMVDVAKYFMDFCRDESCGKCVPVPGGHHPDVDAPRQDHARQGRPRWTSRSWSAWPASSSG